MYSTEDHRQALRMLAAGDSLSKVSRQLGVSRSALRAWRDDGPPHQPHRGECPRCDSAPLDEGAYASLLGFYLGDGTIAKAATYHSLRVSCDRQYPGIVADVEGSILRVRPRSSIFHVAAPGVVIVHANWTHWPCLFPQHGPGRKHDRRILLEPWQERIADRHPAGLLRGLFHSDGARVANWATRAVAGEPKRYDYPRWQFSNRSDDIHAICQQALDTAGIPWRRSSALHTSVSTRAGVAALDELIGPKR
ncbi:helix-turn-helix domain-containing protein [Nocardioides alcanivorans]|uniref:helix-turn-helix domain-containing protein n=1 Tax=Nocardioides alcanivorans TaxID=2897352 RepID=UPI001F1A6454|nr:helix-turn-helix domain-containing protein [Nocardioides alcanivorans]